MEEIYRNVLELEEMVVDSKITQGQKIKDTVTALVTNITPELYSICKKLGIYDTENFGKAVCRNILDQIKIDAGVVTDKNADQEIREISLKISNKISKLRKLSL